MPGIIFLIGFSGSGKSAVGPGLARKMKRKFVDIDAEIERKAGMSIPNIFKRYGERGFRKRERQTIEIIIKDSSQKMVVALGGGALVNPVNRKLILTSGTTVFLSCSVRELYRRLKDKTDRPLLEVRVVPGGSLRETRLEKIKSLLNKRLPVYRQCDMIVPTTSKNISQVVTLIQRKITNHEQQYPR